MASLRCDVCDGPVLYEEARGYFHADPRNNDHLPFPVPVVWEVKPGDSEAGDPADGEEGLQGNPDG